jgi:hypothetical protein
VSTNKNKKTSKGWGGYRPGSGPKKGSGSHKKISVSVDRNNWQNALYKSKLGPSQLVNELILEYVLPETE